MDYHIVTDEKWVTGSVRIDVNLDGSSETIIRDPLADLKYIDISLTPITNTLPINNLGLKTGERAVIDVLYFDILEKTVQPVKQVYTRLAADKYLYENYDGSFSAEITVDEFGLVKDYPGLFERV